MVHSPNVLPMHLKSTKHIELKKTTLEIRLSVSVFICSEKGPGATFLGQCLWTIAAVHRREGALEIITVGFQGQNSTSWVKFGFRAKQTFHPPWNDTTQSMFSLDLAFVTHLTIYAFI